MGDMWDDIMVGARVLGVMGRALKKTVKATGRVIMSEPVQRTAHDLKEKTKALAEQAGETLQQKMSQDRAELGRRQADKRQAQTGGRHASSDKRQTRAAEQWDDADEWQDYFSGSDDFDA